jgi:hypothetical protein
MQGASSLIGPGLPHTAAYSGFALAAGHDRLWIAFVMANPSATMAPSPTNLARVALSHRVGGDETERARRI